MQSPSYGPCRLCGHTGPAADIVRVAGATRQVAASTWTVWRCGACSSINALEPIDAALVYRDYPIQKQQYDAVSRAMFAKRLRILERAGLQRGDRVLDHGCGSGHFVRYLRERGYDAHGFDPYNPRMNDPAVLDTGFDVVCSQDVIEHVETPRDFLRDLARCARPGGLLVVGTPFADHVDLHDRVDQLGVLHQPFHRFILSRAQCNELFQAPGWQLADVIEACYIDTRLPFANTQFLFRLFDSFDGLMDPAFESVSASHVLRHPTLLFWGLFGSLLARRQDLFAVMRQVVD